MKSPADNFLYSYDFVARAEYMKSIAPWYEMPFIDCLKQAVLDNDTALLQQALKDGRAELLSDDFDNSPFRVACEVGNRQWVDFFFKHGVSMNRPSRRGVTPLMVACMHGHQKLAEHLLALGADIYAKTYDGMTTPMAACMGRLEDFAMRLLDLGVSAFQPLPHRESLLNLSLLFSQKRLAERILREAQAQGEEFLCAQINEPCSRGYTPFLTACGSGLEDIALQLMEKGADLSATNNRDENALYITSITKCEDSPLLVQGLIDAGLSPFSGTAWGGTALRAALTQGNMKTVKVLVKAGALSAVDGSESWISWLSEPMQKLLKKFFSNNKA